MTIKRHSGRVKKLNLNNNTMEPRDFLFFTGIFFTCIGTILMVVASYPLIK